MVALVIVLIAVLIITLLLLSSVKVKVVSDGRLSLRVGLGCIMLDVLKKKKKRIRLGDFTQKKYLNKINELKKPQTSRGKKPKTEKGEKTPLSETVDFIFDLLGRLDTYTGRLRTGIKRLEVSVGGKDPAAVALAYGVASQSVAYLIEVLDNKTKLTFRKDASVSVKADYFSESFEFNADVEISLRVIDGLRTVIEILMLKAKHETNKINTRKAGQENV